jgi:hypothetical protein
MEITEKALNFFKSTPWAIDAERAKLNASKVEKPVQPDARTLVDYLDSINSIYQAILIVSSYGIDHINLRINSNGKSNSQGSQKVELIKKLFTDLGYYVFARRYRPNTPEEFYKVRINWGK